MLCRSAFPLAPPLFATGSAAGRPALFVNPHFTTGFDGMTEEESRPLLAVLYEVATRPENIYRHRWRVGDVLMWDNRCTNHKRTEWDNDLKRLMYRVQIAGSIPF